MEKSLQSFVFLFVLLFSASVFAGPFGTEMGDKPEKFSKLQALKEYSNTYMTDSPPKKHPSFYIYFLRIDEKEGLYEVFTATKEYKFDNYGEKALEIYNELKNNLISKYGNGKTYESIKEDSSWKERKYFARSIALDDRIHEITWKFDNKNEENIERIDLFINAETNDSTKVILGYTYNNAKAIKEKIKKEENKQKVDAL